MNSKHARTLAAIFTDPVSPSIAWASIESLLVAIGCEVIEGRGSRVKFVKENIVASFHRPHPEPEARRYQVRDTREYLVKLGVRTMNVLSYKGYAATIEFDADELILVGRIAGIEDVIGFHADNPQALTEAFHEALDDYLETCRQIGKNPEKPFSGNMMLRVDPVVHRQAALAAQLVGVSLSQFGEEALRRLAEKEISERVSTKREFELA